MLANGVTVEKALAKLKAAASKKARQEQRSRRESVGGIEPSRVDSSRVGSGRRDALMCSMP